VISTFWSEPLIPIVKPPSFMSQGRTVKPRAPRLSSAKCRLDS
jgi:hypothetical protein